jgi:hypothetical protein
VREGVAHVAGDAAVVRLARDLGRVLEAPGTQPAGDGFEREDGRG